MEFLPVCGLLPILVILRSSTVVHGKTWAQSQTVSALEGTNVTINSALVGHIIDHVTRLTLHNSKTRLMTYICDDNDLFVHKSELGRRRRYTVSYNTRRSELSVTIWDMKQTDEGVYTVTIVDDDGEEYAKNTTIKILKASDITYMVNIGPVTYNLSVGENGTDVTLSGDGPVEIEFTSCRPDRIYPSDFEGEFRNIHHRSATYGETNRQKIVDISFPVQNLPRIRLWKSMNLDQDNDVPVAAGSGSIRTHVGPFITLIPAVAYMIVHLLSKH